MNSTKFTLKLPSAANFKAGLRFEPSPTIGGKTWPGVGSTSKLEALPFRFEPYFLAGSSGDPDLSLLELLELLSSLRSFLSLDRDLLEPPSERCRL
jgi:hypothetical protein